jgi:tetratricopeptide (TPR) repeat protein
VEARYGLAQFYLRAPGIAGGSIKKAREQAEALLGIERGVMWGHITLGQIAADDEKWDEMTSRYERALEAATETDLKVMVLATHAFALLREKKDHAAAMEVAKKLDGVAPADDPTAAFVMGEAHRALKEYAAAIEAYLTVIAKRPDSRSSRYALAQCYEANSEYAKAVEQYQVFADRFPTDDRASEAKSKVKKLEKKLGK